jgi:hypothetical protein
MLCVAFFASTRGVCATGERPWSNQEIAAALPGDIGTNMECIAELLAKGVAQRDSRGAIFSRRMVRDDQERRATAERVRKLRTACNASVTVDVTPLYANANANASCACRSLQGYRESYSPSR